MVRIFQSKCNMDNLSCLLPKLVSVPTGNIKLKEPGSLAKLAAEGYMV